MQSERTGIENKWFALTGRVVELKVEEDGDLHIALHVASPQTFTWSSIVAITKFFGGIKTVVARPP